MPKALFQVVLVVKFLQHNLALYTQNTNPQTHSAIKVLLTQTFPMNVQFVANVQFCAKARVVRSSRKIQVNPEAVTPIFLSCGTVHRGQ